MTGVVNVVDGAVAETPEAALARGRAEQAASLAAGTKAYETVNPQTTGSHVTVPLVGSREDRFSLLRFARDPLVIAAGTTDTWTIQDPFKVYTVRRQGGVRTRPPMSARYPRSRLSD
jgi:hypothetical protein